VPETLKTDLRKRMTSAYDVFVKELGGLRTGRASPTFLDPVMVEAYGSSTPLQQVGNVNVPEPRLLTVQVWDSGLVKAVEKAIRDANLGVNPSVDGNLIRIPLPELTQDRRLELAKLASKYAENARIAVRGVRRDGMDQLKKMEKDKVLSEDQGRRISEEIQTLTDELIGKIDQTLAVKEKELSHL
jgi:ribosome recycling factor